MSMKFEVLPPLDSSLAPEKFNAMHALFKYEVGTTNPAFLKHLKKSKFIIVVGLGGSVLPLKAFVDFFQLQERVLFLDTVDPIRWHRFSKLKGAVFCVVSKSGETFEIKALLAELIAARRIKDLLIVTDEKKGMLRTFAEQQKIQTLSIPSEIGGRFTNFSVFHQAVLEACGIKFKPLLKCAKDFAEFLKKDSRFLSDLHQQLFNAGKSILVLWGYGDRSLGFCQWAQQVIAESLGKINIRRERIGITPIALQGPQDQHSVLQILSDGPQDKVIWFFETKMAKSTRVRKLKEPFNAFNRVGLSEGLSILCESTFQTFKERLENPETAQPIARFQWASVEDFVQSIVLIQALTEYSASILKLNAFDQPGVERGKEIARSLLKARG